MPNPFETSVTNAIRWAEARLGSPAYPFRCLAFVEDAYERANGVEIFGGSTAAESALLYGASAEHNQVPPPGAFVFYDWWGAWQGEYKNWGHVGLCVGDEQVIHAWDCVRRDHYRAIEGLAPAAGGESPRYRGWAPVERIFLGHRPRR